MTPKPTNTMMQDGSNIPARVVGSLKPICVICGGGILSDKASAELKCENGHVLGQPYEGIPVTARFKKDTDA